MGKATTTAHFLLNSHIMPSIEPSSSYDGLAYLNSGYRRFFDLLLCLVLWIPVHVVLGLVWLGTLGFRQNSFLFVQERIGHRGQMFRIYKLRTIRTNHPTAHQFTHTDQDLLPKGSFLRRWRIDEFPQIWNVLKGEMSWIGPRPEVPYHYHKCVQEIPGYADRQLALPGITGWAQLQNPNATADDNEAKLPHDIYYLQHASLRLDAVILIRTLQILQ